MLLKDCRALDIQRHLYTFHVEKLQVRPGEAVASLELPPPGNALLAAFKGDLPAALLAEQYERAARYLATHGHAARGDPHEDLLPVRTHATSLTKSALKP